MISKSKSLKLPRYKVLSLDDGAVPFTDFDEFNWNGKIITKNSLIETPIYGSNNIIQYGGNLNLISGTNFWVITNPKLTLIYDELNSAEVEEEINDTPDKIKYLLDNHISLYDGFTNNGKSQALNTRPQNYYNLFPCNDSTTINNEYYDLAGSLHNYSLFQGKVLEKRFYGGDLLLLLGYDLGHLTNVDVGFIVPPPDGNFGLNAVFANTDGFGNLIDIEYTLRNELVSLIQDNLNTVFPCFRKLKIVIKMFWHEAAETVSGIIGSFAPALETEANSTEDLFSGFDYVEVENVGRISDATITPIFSLDDVWDQVTNFFSS